MNNYGRVQIQKHMYKLVLNDDQHCPHCTQGHKLPEIDFPSVYDGNVFKLHVWWLLTNHMKPTNGSLVVETNDIDLVLYLLYQFIKHGAGVWHRNSIFIWNNENY